jgi:hypothetical protein
MRLHAPSTPLAAFRSALISSALALFAGTATAQTGPQPPFPAAPPFAYAETAAGVESGPVLKRLPAGKEELTFRGENATRSWTVVFSRAEVARTAALQIAMLNAVSVLPERSVVKISINGTPVASLPAASAGKAAVLSIKIPAGVLVPGANTVLVSTALSHRVDCSVKATYELWAMLDPARTGFLVPRDAAYGSLSLDELAAEPLAEDGATHIRLRMGASADPAEIAEAGRFIHVLGRRAGLSRPVVEVGPEPGQGPGFDVILDRVSLQEDIIKRLKLVSRSGAITIGRDPASARLVVVLSGRDGAELDGTIASLGTAQAGRTIRNGDALEGGARKSFSDLGFVTDNFAGRRYVANVDVNLPSDFYPANDRARVWIDGAHSAFLVEGSALIFRVNGTLVSTIPLAAGKAERFEHELVELPLRFFHPGHNNLSIEGLTSASYDQQCDLTAMPRDARLTIAGSSAFELPDFAHLVTLPQIPAALAYDAAPGGGPVHLYLADSDRGSVGAGLTVLANMAASQADLGTPVFHFGGPAQDDAPGILIAPADQLPGASLAALRKLLIPVTATQPDTNANAAPGPEVLDQAAVANETRLVAGVHSAIAMAEAALRSRGFFFGTEDQTALLPASDRSMLIASLAPEPDRAPIGGVNLPQFIRDPAHWLVITAPAAALYEEGIRRLIVSGQWDTLSGQAANLDLQSGDLHSIQPSRITYVVPSRLVLRDLRPILGGIVSNNIVLSIGSLMLLMAILGVSTHALLRRTGVK